MMDTKGKLYIGRQWELETKETVSDALLYDPDDLTTHGVVVGMTGSGKTGLCIDLLEDAALQGIPAMMIDPKGDITNTLLHFPQLLPEDFAPWINPDEARREGKSIEEAAEDTAELWRSGLAQWNIEGDRIQALKESAAFAIYTPGSDAGLPVSILASLAAPPLAWDDNRELIRERISSTVTALLGLAGLTDIDPVTSREHVLLANIFEQAWSKGSDLDLGELIMQIQAPPMDKIGYLETDAFFPAKDRFALAARFNNLLAAPTFRAWIEGDPLDIEMMLYTEDGRPRHTVFYIAHLSDQERMFFVTLFFSAVETWMRSQTGTSTLRSLIYFDELFGYLPPSSNPPSKEPLLRLLKQARAFGVGLLLATQNPVDIDYKALSNAGSWFIGRLSTARDKERLIDGLAGAAGGDLDKRALSDAISALGKRVFLLRNVHEREPVLFQTRWAMNYLAGPVSRVQIPAMNQLAGAQPIAGTAQAQPSGGPAGAVSEAPSAAASQVEETLPGTRSRPPIPQGVDELFLRPTLRLEDAAAKAGRDIPRSAREQGLIYYPALFAQAAVRYNARKYGVKHDKELVFVAEELGGGSRLDWETFIAEPELLDSLDSEPEPDARFVTLEKPLSDKTALRNFEKDLADWIYREAPMMVKVNEALELYAGPDVDEQAFLRQSQGAADKRLQEDEDELEDKYRRKVEAVEKKLQKERRELAEDEAEVSRRKQQEYTSYAETLFSFLGGRRRSLSTAMSKRGQRSRAEEDVQESIEEIAGLEKDIAELQEALAAEVDGLEEKWAAIVADFEQVPVPPYKKDIDVHGFGVAWLPYYLVQDGDRLLQIAAYDAWD